MAAKRYVSYKEGIAGSRAAQRARGVVQLPVPIRKGLSVLPFVLPVGSIYQGVDDREGETGSQCACCRSDYEYKIINMSGDNQSIINLGDLSRPATVLVEKIAEATGGIFKPWQIKRVAKAEAESDVIKAASKLKITRMQLRGLQRLIYEEAKKQKNIEDITLKALPLLNKDAKPENVEDDWFTNFFDKSRLISDQDMQNIWAKILAGEANNPGSYSKRTINFMESLDKKDATLFSKLCNFNWFINGEQPLIFNISEDTYIKNGLNFGILTHLDTIGLITFNNLAGYQLERLPRKIVVTYQNTPLILEFNNVENNKIKLGQVMLTEVGKQLAKVCITEKIVDFDMYVIKQWVNGGIKVSTPIEIGL
jgi:Protein of unknown function (DUF2806)